MAVSRVQALGVAVDFFLLACGRTCIPDAVVMDRFFGGTYRSSDLLLGTDLLHEHWQGRHLGRWMAWHHEVQGIFFDPSLRAAPPKGRGNLIAVSSEPQVILR